MHWPKNSFALFDDFAPGSKGGGVLFSAPIEEIVAFEPGDVPTALAALEGAAARGLHAAGFFAYELGYAIEPKLLPVMPKARRFPLLSFGLFRPPQRLSATDVTAWLAARAPGNTALGPFAATMSFSHYARAFAAVQDLIRAGDCYQANLTFKLRHAFSGEGTALFRALRAGARAGHAAFLSLDGLQILSLSPELFFEMKDGTVRVRPMKGTAPRGAQATDDLRARRFLAEDIKSRAENLMIVDLLRNDLGRIAKTGSVNVETLYEIETYPTLHQMTSTVRAVPREDIGIVALIKALFPCGSVTGAPKIRAMEIIRDLEDEPRGLYCGSIGHIAPGGDMHFNVAIRTLTITDGTAEMGIGSGLVADSDLRAEYDECLLKARFLHEEPFGLIETLLWEPGRGYALLGRHLSRLKSSAEELGFVCDKHETERVLMALADPWQVPTRVRLLLSQEGAIETAATPLADQQTEVTFAISEHPVSSTNRLLYHKTTRRKFFEDELARHTGRAGEVVFLNERGEITEGTRTNLFLAWGGTLLTPAVSCGLLPGTLRADLIDDGRCKEAILTPPDLAGAEIYLGNSVRGLIPARLVDANAC